VKSALATCHNFSLKKIYLPISPYQVREASQNYTDEASFSASSAAVQLLCQYRSVGPRKTFILTSRASGVWNSRPWSHTVTATTVSSPPSAIFRDLSRRPKMADSIAVAASTAKSRPQLSSSGSIYRYLHSSICSSCRWCNRLPTLPQWDGGKHWSMLFLPMV
jgi:hypothetical protein